MQGAVVVRGGGEQRLGRVAAADAGGLWCRGLRTINLIVMNPMHVPLCWGDFEEI